MTLASLTTVDPTTQARSTQYYASDALGSTSELTDAAAAVQVSYRYDAWGNVIQTAGSSANTKQFTGQQADAETGLQYFGARYYDPTTGTFITQDSYPGQEGDPASLNRYSYVQGNPLAYTDPTGQYIHILAGAVVGAVGGAVLRGLKGGDWGDIAAGAAVGAVIGGVAHHVRGLAGGHGGRGGDVRPGDGRRGDGHGRPGMA